MTVFVLEVSLHLLGPVLTRSTAPGVYGLDAVAARAAQYERRPEERDLVLPGTLVAGKLRHAWAGLADLGLSDFDEAQSLLGRGSEGEGSDGGSVEPERKTLFISDFTVAPKPDDAGATLTRIRISPTTGVVEKGALLVAEAPFQAGESVEFKGRIKMIAANPEAAETVRQQLVKVLRWIGQFGSGRGIGYGRLLKVEVSQPEEEARKYAAQVSSSGDGHAPERMALALRPLDPFCVSTRRVGDNIFEGSEIIPGGALLGAIAFNLGGREDMPEALAKVFDRIRVTHAFPARLQPRTRPQLVPLNDSLFGDMDLRRPVMWPQSLVRAAGRLFDVAVCDGPGLIDGEAPAFAVDWKDDADVRDRFGWGDPGRELRVRTAIDRTRRRAEDEQLFAQESVVPDGHVWLAEIDLSAVPDSGRAEVWKALRESLGERLLGLGKTKAEVQIAMLLTDSVTQAVGSVPAADVSEGNRNTWIVTLQTPALMLDTAALNETSGAVELRKLYERFWSDVSGSTLKLSHFFASQTLQGGPYLHRRFSRVGEGATSTGYKPWLLTDAGSVFVLTTENQQRAEDKLEALRKCGLPITDELRRAYGLDSNEDEHWRHCPFTRRNGYGEVAVNLKVHDELSPRCRFQPFEMLELTGEADAAGATSADSGSVPDLAPASDAVLEDPGPEDPGPEPAADIPSTDNETETDTGSGKLSGTEDSAQEGQDPPTARWFITGILRLTSPLHLGTGVRKKLGEDDAGEQALVARDIDDIPYIPGSSLKGVLRSWHRRRCPDGEETEIMQRLFGTGSSGKQAGDGTGGILAVQDAFCSSAPEESGLPGFNADRQAAAYTRIALDRATGTVRPGFLAKAEILPVDTEFRVLLELDPATEEDVAMTLAMLRSFDGTDQAPALGALTGSGNGRAIWVEDQEALFRIDRQFLVEELGETSPDPSQQSKAVPSIWSIVTGEAPESLKFDLERLKTAITASREGFVNHPLVSLDLCLTFDGPMLVRDQHPDVADRNGGNDESRDGKSNSEPFRWDADGRFILPATSLRGALRAQAERIMRTIAGGPGAIPDMESHDLITFLFGSSRQRGALRFSHMAQTDAKPPSLGDLEVQDFVAVDRFSGAGGRGGKKFNARPLLRPTFQGAITLDPVVEPPARLLQAALGLLVLLFRDLHEGDIHFGMGAAKGYGACQVDWSRSTLAMKDVPPGWFGDAGPPDMPDETVRATCMTAFSGVDGEPARDWLRDACLPALASLLGDNEIREGDGA